MWSKSSSGTAIYIVCVINSQEFPFVFLEHGDTPSQDPMSELLCPGALVIELWVLGGGPLIQCLVSDRDHLSRGKLLKPPYKDLGQRFPALMEGYWTCNDRSPGRR